MTREIAASLRLLGFSSLILAAATSSLPAQSNGISASGQGQGVTPGAAPPTAVAPLPYKGTVPKADSAPAAETPSTNPPGAPAHTATLDLITQAPADGSYPYNPYSGCAVQRPAPEGTASTVFFDTDFDITLAIPFLRPQWGHIGDFAAVFPTTDPKVFAVLGNTDGLFNEFQFPSSIKFGAQMASSKTGGNPAYADGPTSSPAGLGASGDYLDMEGHINRSFVSNNVKNSVQETGKIQLGLYVVPSLTLTLANPFSGNFESPTEYQKRVEHGYIDDGNSSRPESTPCMIWDASIGPCLGTMQQSFNSIFKGTSTTTLNADQSFTGLGFLTSSEMYFTLFTDKNQVPFRFVTGLRGAVLSGQETRDASIDMAGTPVLIENKTTVIPFGEIQLGFEYGKKLTEKPAGYYASNRTYAASDQKYTTFIVQAGFIGQIWGGGGLVSAVNATQGRLSDTNLLVYGGYLLFGFQR